MSNLTPRGGGFGTLPSRSMGRALGRMNGQTQLGTVQIDGAAELQARQIEAIAYVARTAAHELTMLLQLECQLSALVPTATGRVQAVTDLACLTMAEVVGETARRARP